MKIIWRHGDRSIEFERQPMPPERFNTLCKLAGAVIGGGGLLVAARMVGIWAIVWSVGALALIGIYKLVKTGL